MLKRCLSSCSIMSLKGNLTMIYRFALLLISAAVLLGGCARTSTGPLAPAGHEAVVVAGAQDDRGIVPDPAKKVYLTFDDGPNSHFTELILDVLKKAA